MKKLNELQSLLNLTLALGQTPDPELLAEVEKLEAREKRLRERVRKNIATDLNELNSLVPAPPVAIPVKDPLQELKELMSSLGPRPQPEDIPVLENEETWAQRVIDETPEVITEVVTEPEPAPVQEPQPETLIDKTVKSITETVVSQGDPVLVDSTNNLEIKVKQLEKWISKIAATGPGGGSAWLWDLQDVHPSTKNVTDTQILAYDGVLGKWINKDHVVASLYILPYATTSTLGGIIVDSSTMTMAAGRYGAKWQLGEFYVSSTQILGGTVSNADITLAPNGTGGVVVPKLKLPVGSVISGTGETVVIVAPVIINTLNWSTGTALAAGAIGGISPGVPAPWTIYQFTSSVLNLVQINDILGGAGVPVTSTVRWVGTTTATGTYVIVDSATYDGQPALTIPTSNSIITVARPIVNAGLVLSTTSNTDITLNPGDSGNVVVHSNVVPYTNNVWSLGTPTKRWSDIWFGPGTIYIQDETLNSDQAIGARDGNLYVLGAAGFKVGEWLLRDNYISINNAARDVYIGNTSDTGRVLLNRPFSVFTTGQLTTFNISRNGRVSVYTPSIPANDTGAVSIIGSTNGAYQPVTNSGGMLHITGNDGAVSRITNDAFGTASFPAYISRVGRGTAETPSATQAGDIMTRFSTVGWGTTNYVPTTGAPAPTTIEVYAKENFTDTSAGTEYRISTTPLGSTSKTLSLTVDSTGISFSSTTTGAGITFRDGSRQTSATVVATTSVLGIVRPDGETITIDSSGTISANHYYASFYDTSIQTSSATSAQAIRINGTAIDSHGVTVISGNTIKMANAGLYNLQFSLQMKNTDNAQHNSYFWLRQNGADIDTSNTTITTPAAKNAGNPGFVVAAWNFFIYTTSNNETAQLMWWTPNNTISIASAAQSSATVSSPRIPATPGVIITVNTVEVGSL